MTNDILRFRGVELIPLQRADDIREIYMEIMRDLPSRLRLAPEWVSFEDAEDSTWTKEVFAIAYRGAMIGYVRVHIDRWARIGTIAGLGILPTFQRKGAGVLAGIIAARYLFEVMGCGKIESQCFEFNDASRRIQDRYLTLEGRRRAAIYIHGRCWDVLRYGMMWEEYDALAGQFFQNTECDDAPRVRRP